MDPIAFAQQLTRFESTHENPAAMQACLDACLSVFEGTKAVVKRYEYQPGCPFAIVATEDTRTPDVLLLGHIDTVPGASSLFEGTIRDGKLYGRGTLDMKAFVATSVVLMKELVDDGCAKSVALAIVSDEEMGGVHGARRIVEDLGYRPKIVLVPDDGEDIRTIVNETKHLFQVRLRATGVESHAARPWAGTNAIDLLIASYTALRESFPAYTEEPDDTWVTTMNLGTISGGIASNEVAGTAEMLIDIRAVRPQTRETIEARLAAACASGVSFEILLEGHPTNLDQQDPHLAAYIQAIEEEVGGPVSFRRSGGGTDGRYFAALGIPTIVHQGSGAFCQTDDEHVVVDTLPQLVSIQRRFIQNL